ncbi:hypothetical protein LX36DRAFT_653662 [Colletotrichum falcatum]|nr:hypothetical protein LX36DRAFT_653662 [Colletotrichum falcatum]
MAVAGCQHGNTHQGTIHDNTLHQEFHDSPRIHRILAWPSHPKSPLPSLWPAFGRSPT